jgi:hypothetical protein
MKLRLHGTEDECREMTGLLEQIMTVQAVSEPYPDRGRSVLVRVYVEGIPRRPAGESPPGRQDQRAAALAQRMSRKSGGAR